MVLLDNIVKQLFIDLTFILDYFSPNLKTMFESRFQCLHCSNSTSSDVFPLYYLKTQ